MKTNTKRSLLLSALVVFFVAIAGLMLINFNFSYSASAEGTFAMGGGAEIFTIQDENVQDLEDVNGIRFSTTLSETFDASLKTKEGDTVKYYTLVGVGNFTVEDLTVDKIDNVNKTVRAFGWSNIEFLDGKYVHNTNVINIPKIGYRDLIVARSYAIVTDANGVESAPIYATGTDSVRSLEGLANVGMYQFGDDNGMEVYVLGENGQVIVTETPRYLLVDRDATITLDGLTSKPEKATVYVGARRVFDATIAEDGSITLPASYVQSLTKNNSYLITVLDGVNAYRGFISTYDYVMEIATPSDFVKWYELQNTNKYVKDAPFTPDFVTAAYLTNNIDMSDVTLAKYTANTCAAGILDGQGYTISNLTIAGEVGVGGAASVNNSLFYASYFMTYTNVAFENLIGNGGYLFGRYSNTFYNVVNCYIEYNTPVLANGINHISTSAKYENVVLVLTQPATTIFRSGNNPAAASVKNLIVVAADSNGAALTLPVAYSNSYSVASIEEIVDTDIDWSKWDENYWTIDEKEGIAWTGKAGTVIEEVEIDGVFEKALNRDAKLTIDLTSAGTFSEADVKSVSIDGAPAEFTFADNKVAITSDVAAGEHAVKVTTTAKVIYADAIVYNYAISNWTELKSFLTDIKGATTVYGYLENNVTYGVSTHVLSTDQTKVYLDGKGYTIDGGFVRNGFFGQMTGTLKNIALTNIQSSKDSKAQGIISWGDGGMKLENVYIHANFAKNGLHADATTTCMNYGIAATTTYTNVVIHVESPEGINGYTFSYNNVKWAETNVFTNVYTFSNTAIGIDGDTLNDTTDNIAEDNGIKHFSNIDTYRENAQTIVDTLGSDWTLVDGLPTFESAKDLVKETYVFTVECGAANMVDGVAQIVPGTYTVTASGISLPATYALEAPVTGVSLSGSTLTVADSVAADTEFTVVGSIYEYMYATTYTAELTFRVLGTTEIAGDAQRVAKNRVGNVTFDMSEYGTFTTDMISSVSFNDAIIEGATFEGNVLTVPWSNFTPAETTKDMVAVIANGGSTYAVTIPVTAYHFVIGNETEFNNWRNSAGTYTGTAGGLAPTYAILDGNVALENALTGFNTAAKRGMVGFLDGAGYTVSNIKITGSKSMLFSNVYNFTFKNIGLDITSASYYFLAENINATSGDPSTGNTNNLINCYISLKGTAYAFSHIGGLFDKAENLVINYQMGGVDQTKTGCFFRSSVPTTMKNILGIGYNTRYSNAQGIIPTESQAKAVNCAEFETLELASTNLLSETPSFDTSVFATTEMQNYWTIGANGFPVWKNA